MNKSELYINLLQKLNNLEINNEENDDSDEIVNAIDQLRREICGCQAQTNENISSKTEMTTKIYNDLIEDTITNDQIEHICKLVAELCKNDDCRKALVEQNLFEALNKCFTKLDITDLTRIQMFRAIGNMCYYNDSGRLAYLKSDGLSHLFESMTYSTNSDHSTLSDEDKNTKYTLITVLLGCLHNVSNENETLRKAIYDLNVMSILKKFIPFIKQSQGILIHLGSCLENLLDLDPGKEQFKEEKLALALYQNLDSDLILSLDDYAEDFFNVLTLVNDIEMSKYYMFQTDFLVKLINALEASSTNLNLSRHISLFLVSLVVKDEKIDEIFTYKDNLILNKAIDWLVNFKVEQFYIASAVIIANYLRSDENVKKLVEDPRQPHIKIIDILRSFHSISSPTLQNINIIHSLLGSLRNFCVALNMRSELLKCNLIETVLPFCNYENLEVKSKSLSIIRLMVKNCTQTTGLDLIFNAKTLETFEKIAVKPDDHPIIVGESSRLCCYLPIAAKSEANIEKFCQYKFIPVICNQLNSEHMIMLNEALLALNFLVTINYRASKDQLKESTLNEHLKKCLTKEKIPFEMRLNALKLFQLIHEKNSFFTKEDSKEYLVVLNKLKLIADNDFLKSHVTQIIDAVEESQF